MVRLCRDIPRWLVLQHRIERRLPLVETDDSADLRFQDELFASFHRSESTPVRVNAESGWGEIMHQAASPIVDSVTQYTACDVAKSALATAWAVEILAWQIEQAKIEVEAKVAREREEEDLIKVGLNQVDRGPAAGTEIGRQRGRTNDPRLHNTIVKAQQDHRLRRIAILAGRFKKTTVAKYKRELIEATGTEVVSIETGAEIARLIPSELVKFASNRLRKLAHASLLERKLLQYKVTSTPPPERLAKGPIVLCLDKSGSMEGDRDVWASAATLAILDLALHQKRTFGLIVFDARVRSIRLVEPGGELPLDDILVKPDGGTSIWGVVDEALKFIARRKEVRKADIILITDGCEPYQPGLKDRADALGVTLYGIGIGATIGKWVHEEHVIGDLENIDEQAERALFGMK